MVVHAVRLGRTVLASAFMYAAWTKLRQPWETFALSVDSYRILPEWAVLALARMRHAGPCAARPYVCALSAAPVPRKERSP